MESRQAIQVWRGLHLLSVDVEAASIAELVHSFNTHHGTHIRFGATLVVTDFPMGPGELPVGRGGLESPDYLKKAEAKRLYCDLLRILFHYQNTPRERPSSFLILQFLHFNRLSIRES